MKRFARILGFAAATGVSFLARPVAAGPFGDDLAKCLVRSTGTVEKTLLF